MQKKEKYRIKLNHGETLPFAFTGEEYATPSADPCMLWIAFCFVGLVAWMYSFLAVLIVGAVIVFYRYLSSIRIKVLSDMAGPVLEVKKFDKTHRLETPIRLNAIWKYDKDPGGLTNQLDRVVFLQVRDRNNVLTTFYERNLMSDRYPHEARYVTDTIEVPRRSFKVERIDELLEYLSRALPPELIIFEEEKNSLN